MMRAFEADLHLHTCLSPCAELDMTPGRIVAEARRKALDIIAITDHNSAENVEAAQRAARGTEVTVLGGMEITTSEEVHILALFDDPEGVSSIQKIVYEHLPGKENDERLYGRQVVVNEFDEVMGFNRRLLITATGLSLSRLVEEVCSLGGISIASHIDRANFSVLSQLGFMPHDLRLDAIEFSPRKEKEEAEQRFGNLKRFPWVSFSDAHHVADIGRRTVTFMMEAPTLSEIRLSLEGRDGRGLSW